MKKFNKNNINISKYIFNFYLSLSLKYDHSNLKFSLKNLFHSTMLSFFSLINYLIPYNDLKYFLFSTLHIPKFICI